ncbi:MAG: PEP-utilizing enzyme [bacterium]|nr:PEP-utilizing enzyme [bacterium]
MLNPKKELFRWGPIPGRFFFTSVFSEITYKYFCRQKYLGENWPPTLFLFKNGRMVWINEYPALRASGRRVFVKYILPRKFRRKIYAEWKQCVRRLAALEKRIDGMNLKKLSNEQLLSLWSEFHKLYIEFWVPATVPELGNYGADGFFEEKLKKYVKNEMAVSEITEALTVPMKSSFYQEEEIDLAKAKDLFKHQQKYFWLKNSYFKTQVLPVKFFVKRKKDLPKNLSAEIFKKLKQAGRRKRAIKNKYRLPKEIMEIATGISNGISWQDERKKYIFIALHYQALMLKEAARRCDYNYDEMLNTWFWEVAEILKGKDYRQELRRRRHGGFGVYFYKSFKNLLPSEVKKYWEVFGEEKVNLKFSEIKGLVVSQGQGKKVRGKARIILDPAKVASFHKGEILIAPMTSPDYIFVIKKAAAIITDAGGLTSHAAIVSRELGIPCIVGAKIATKVLKDGDVVEVDAEKGIVRKI